MTEALNLRNIEFINSIIVKPGFLNYVKGHSETLQKLHKQLAPDMKFHQFCYQMYAQMYIEREI